MKSHLLNTALLSLIVAIILIFWRFSSGGIAATESKIKSITSENPAISETVVDDFIKNQSENQSMRWFYSNPASGLRGCALVIHGLNLRPEKMQPIISQLTAADIDVLRLSLRGHGKNYTLSGDLDEEQARMETFRNVSYPVWMNEAYLAYSQLKKRAEMKEVPLYLAAFSLGGLIGLDLMASNSDVKFDRLVLFAPAIRLRAKIYLERILSPFGRLVIPSLAPKTYLANPKGTPIAAYNALFDSLKHFNQHADQKLNVPALIFIDEQDEFIPLEKLKELVAEKNWDQWQFYIVNKDETAQEDYFYHHIIDADSTGQFVWQDMMTALMNHLFKVKL